MLEFAFMKPDYPAIAENLRAFTRHSREEILIFLERLVRMESPSLEPASQQPIFRQLYNALEEIGFKATVLKGRQSGGMFFARPEKRMKGQGCQLLLAHCDTVWPIGTLAQMPLSRDGNELRGPGVYDMKAGITQIVFALKAITSLGLEPPLLPLFFVSSDEELGSEDSRHLIELMARRVRRVFVPEPSTGPTGKLKTRRKGVGLYEVKVRGKSAHAGVEPRAGVNAIVEIARVVERLHRLNDFDRGVTVNVGVIEGGSRANVVPSASRILVDVRVPTLEDAQRIEQAIQSLEPTLEGAEIEVSGCIDRPPMEATLENRKLWEQAKELGGHLGLKLEESESGGASDGNLTSPYTATLDGLGGVGGGAHAAHEFIYIDHLLERTALMALLILAPDTAAPSS